MIYDEDNYDILFLNSLCEEFVKKYFEFHSDKFNKLSEYKLEKDKNHISIFKNQYPFLKNSKFCNIYKLFEYQEFEKFNKINKFKEFLFQKLSKKIKGIFKHGQCAKTELCCYKMVYDLKKDYITIAITKNTLLANKQWTTRCINFMKKHGLTNLKNEILVISSTKNDLDGNATHCKNISIAWDKICTTNNGFKVIFLCANMTRVNDICDLLFKFNQPSFNSLLHSSITTSMLGLGPIRAMTCLGIV